MAYRDNWGGKTGSGGVASDDALSLARKQRVRELTLETVDLKKDPYLMRNHLGSYECKLCLTMHNNEGNYLAHTQGRRHQSNLARRAARDAKEVKVLAPIKKKPRPTAFVKIGRPGYKITKQQDPVTLQYSLLIQIVYPEIAKNVQPRFRFMSAFEQRVEKPDGSYQYFLVAAEPYETIAMKIPNWKIDRSEGKFYSAWSSDKREFTVQMVFKSPAASVEEPVVERQAREQPEKGD